MHDAGVRYGKKTELPDWYGRPTLNKDGYMKILMECDFQKMDKKKLIYRIFSAF